MNEQMLIHEEVPKPKLELQPYSAEEIWVALESETMFHGREEIYAYLKDIEAKLSLPFKKEIDERRIFITQTGKQIRIKAGGIRTLKTEELEKIKELVNDLNNE